MSGYVSRRLGCLAIAFGALTGAANAQTAVRLVEVPDGTLMAPWNMTVDGVKDLIVVGANGQKIGEVEEVIGTDPTTPTALVVDFEDGAGFGDRDDVAIPLDRFQMAQGGALLTSSAAEVATLPRWDD
ncbi:PRC-barrel domain-containing protein [Aureimonas psammosilenae]|uniref:PRC-barrel domain-containing protein n=1 Tax=Aureimonas psammosilenae TaxID=2495496 RepID=UPI001260923E|nr:PRC-barrel domain-containing protein [Aureimonas psammosilenae]